MSDKTLFGIGSVMLALAMGLLVSGFILPRATFSQDHDGEGRTANYALVSGVAGTTPKSQTLYLTDDTNEMLFVFEYSSRSKEMVFRSFLDLRGHARPVLEERARRRRGVGR